MKSHTEGGKNCDDGPHEENQKRPHLPARTRDPFMCHIVDKGKPSSSYLGQILRKSVALEQRKAEKCSKVGTNVGQKKGA